MREVLSVKSLDQNLLTQLLQKNLYLLIFQGYYKADLISGIWRVIEGTKRTQKDGMNKF